MKSMCLTQVLLEGAILSVAKVATAPPTAATAGGIAPPASVP